ncbi:MAG: bifunctional metallophosphatase/5'-nucleotidase [Clostridia bacterium]|nr:bifunctional metallophosphatase/5'-nucleotidase [Clostridia bacterium]
MKKSIIALILSMVCVFGACDMGASSSSHSLSESATGNSSSVVNSQTSEKENEDITSEDVNDENRCKGEHEDADNNAICDVCDGSVTVTFDFFNVNDLHGKFTDSDTQPGVDELTTYLKNAKAKNEYTMFLSSGDMWQGGSESNLTKGLIVTDWMNQLGFTSMTPGNHEYDWGAEAVKSNADLANFPFLAINIYDKATNQRVDYCDASTLVTVGEAKIGVIGAIGDCYSSISSDKVTDIYFKTGSELTTLVKNEANSLRSQGADFIVYTIHDGHGRSSSGNITDAMLSGYYDIALSDYVNLVFEGHTHQTYSLKDSKGVYHLQDGGDNDGISHAQVKINIANETATTQKAEFVSTSVYSGLADDPLVGELLEKYKNQISNAEKLLGFNEKTRNSTEILNKTAELYYQTGMERWGDDYDIVLGGGFMQARSPYNIYAGEVRYGDLMSVMPFDNQLVLCSISGSNLQSRFFDLPDSYYIYYGDYGASVKNNIVSSKTYYVVADTYSLQYTPNGLTEVDRYDETTFARDLLAKFIENGGWGSKLPEGEITLTSIPDALAIGKALAVGAETAEVYYVKGTIQSIASTTYGNMTIADENGNTLYIYGTWDKAGANRYGQMTNPPQVGNTVVLVGAIKNYNGTIEMINGRFYSVE